MAKDEVLFKAPAGPSEQPWHNTGFGTMRAVRCELCGTDWPEITSSGESSYSIGIFLGKQFVEECCGRVADILYGEFGDVFVIQFLHDFEGNPLDPKFGLFRMVLKDSLKRIQEKSQAMAVEAEGLQQLAEAL